VEKASEGNCNNVWDLVRLHTVHGDLSKDGGSLEDKLGDIFTREIPNTKGFQLGSEGPNLGMGWPVEGQQDLTEQVGSGPILDGYSSFQISSEGNSAGVEKGITRPRHVGFVKGTWGMATTNGWVLMDSHGQDILTPIVHHGLGNKCRFLEHVDLGAIIHDNIEHRVHTTIHDQLLKGLDGEHSLVSIRFTSRTKQWISGGRGEPTAASFLYGCHGLVVLDGVSLEGSHAVSTKGFSSKLAAARASPCSSGIDATGSRLVNSS
jgi:hypothetical protein